MPSAIHHCSHFSKERDDGTEKSYSFETWDMFGFWPEGLHIAALSVQVWFRIDCQTQRQPSGRWIRVPLVLRGT